jgi:hypothetical protein
VAVLPDDSNGEASQPPAPSTFSNKEPQPPELPESPRRSIRLAARRQGGSSNSSNNSNTWESPLLAHPELPKSPRRSTLHSAARVAAKKAPRQVEEDKKTETEDEEWGANILDAMVDQLGTRKEEVEKDIIHHRWKQ